MYPLGKDGSVSLGLGAASHGMVHGWVIRSCRQPTFDTFTKQMFDFPSSISSVVVVCQVNC